MGLNYKGRSHGPICACCVTLDAGKILVDPTGTASIRRKWRGVLRLRWQKLRVIAKQMLVDQDLLALTSKGALAASNPAIAQGATKIQSFQRFMDWALESVVTGRDGQFMRDMIAAGYDDGASLARRVLKRPVQYAHVQDRVDAITQLAYVELQGIAEAVSQQAVRQVAYALLHNTNPRAVLRAVNTIIDHVGVTRTNTMIELLVVKAFGEGSLDVYQTAGVKNVGLIPEAKAAVKLGDAKRGGGPGSRGNRKTTPSKSTINRIRRAQKKLERLNLVNVLTAGDEDVCPICEGIADDGPYDINTARSLIPAHPHCRCVFVPADDLRFAQ